MLQWSSLRIICSSRFLNLQIRNMRTWALNECTVKIMYQWKIMYHQTCHACYFHYFVWTVSPLVLKHFLDRNHLPWITELGLVHNPEASIPDDLHIMCGDTDNTSGSWSWSVPWYRCRTPPWTCPDPGPGWLSPSSPCSRPCLRSSSRQNCSRYRPFVNLRRMWCEACWSSWNKKIIETRC